MTDIALPEPARPASQGTLVEQSRAVAEVAAAVRVARDFPRDETAAITSMRDLCSRLPIASRAFYEVPNRGSGLSIHIARELARIWQNVDYGVRELSRDDERGMSEMQAWAWDQQTNVRSTRSFLVPHQRMKAGKRTTLTDLADIYLNNQNIGARAVRECIFTVLPGWFVSDAEAVLRTTLRNGDGKPIQQRRVAAIEAFAAVRVTQQQLEDRVKQRADKWSADTIAELLRVYSSITQDGIPVQEFFPDEVVQIPAIQSPGATASQPASD